MEDENPVEQYCDLVDGMLPVDHAYFKFISEVRLAEASLGLAISSGKGLEELRRILDMLDTLASGVIDPDVKLSDPDRKMLNHADEVWLDLKEKMSSADSRAANLLAASAHIRNSVAHLFECRKSTDMVEKVSDYTLKYLNKLSVHTYREAIGHVML